VLIPPFQPGGEIGGLDGFPYYISKRAQFVYAQALKAQIENAANPNSTWPRVRTNLKVAAVFPVSIRTKLADNLILLEDTDFARGLRDAFQASFPAIGLDPSVVGKAYGQLAMLKDPPLGNYIYDLECNPNTSIPCSFQFFPYSLFLGEAAETVSVPLPPAVSVPSTRQARSAGLTNAGLKLSELSARHPTFDFSRYSQYLSGKY
jgi:hypothetical protein